jgi:alkylated DNA repair dioxygenase AlkB
MMPSGFSQNILSQDGAAFYFPDFFGEEESCAFLELLTRDILWQHDEVVLFGKRYITARKVAWYGDQPFEYRYSGNSHNAKPWTDGLQQIKDKIERATGHQFNSCLLNLYHEGNEGMGWHSDDEKTLEPTAAIGSVSFGAVRNFAFRHKESRVKISLELGNGSLLLMESPTQTHWHHALFKTARKTGPRINLTFRKMKV